MQPKLQHQLDVPQGHFLHKADFNQLLNVKNVLLESIVMEFLCLTLQLDHAMQDITVNKELKYQILLTVKQVTFVPLLTIVLSELIIHYLVQKEPTDFQL